MLIARFYRSTCTSAGKVRIRSLSTSARSTATSLACALAKSTSFRLCTISWYLFSRATSKFLSAKIQIKVTSCYRNQILYLPTPFYACMVLGGNVLHNYSDKWYSLLHNNYIDYLQMRKQVTIRPWILIILFRNLSKAQMLAFKSRIAENRKGMLNVLLYIDCLGSWHDVAK